MDEHKVFKETLGIIHNPHNPFVLVRVKRIKYLQEENV